MHYTDSAEKASQYASAAFERLLKEGLVPTPENYELWYVYFADANPEVTRAIDILCSSNQKITNERCQELHQRFLSEGRESEKVREAGDKITGHVAGVGEVALTVGPAE